MKLLIPILALLAVVGGLLPSAQAQTETVIVPWISTWTYDTNEANYDSAWRTLGYDDSAWLSGPAPLGFGATEATPIGQVQTGTTFPARGPITVLFRQEFTFAGDPGSVSLVVSNFADDGALIFINGTRVADFGSIDNGVDPVTATTLAGRGGEAGTRLDRTTAAGTLLNVGNNVVAVEVHQDGAGSSDVSMGTALSVVELFGPTFTVQPQSNLGVVAGETFVLSATVTGAPIPTLQWYFDVDGVGGAPATPIADATGSSLTITNADVFRSGFYFLRATGHTGAVDSSLAQIVVTSDTFPPVLVCAVASSPISITLTVNEELETDPLLSATEDPFAYQLEEIGGPEVLFFGSAALVNGTNVVLGVAPGMMSPDKSYSLRVFGGFVTDLAGNAIDYPDNEIAVLSSRVAVALDAVWQFDQSGVDLGTAWLSNDAPAFANSGAGILGQETTGASVPLIMTDLQAPSEGGPNGHYFRTTFTIPDLSTLKSLTADYYVDDQAAIYINGVEVLRTTAEGDAPIPGVPGEPIPFGTQPTATVGDAALTSGANIPISSVVQGANTLSVYVAQGGATSSDVVWGMILTAVGGGNPDLGIVEQPVATLTINETEDINLSVIATGIEPLSYQWRKGGVAISGETNATLTIASAVPSDSGSYDVVVGDASADPDITSNPSAVTVTADLTAASVVSVVGDGTLTNITITLSEAVTAESVTNGATYSVFRSTDMTAVAVSAVAFDPANPTVIVLQTAAPLTAQINYDVTVAGFIDFAQAMNVTPSTTARICAVVSLFDTGHVWKYDERDVDLGTAWREVGYDDSAWPSGPSTLGFEANLVIATPLQQTYTDGVSITNAAETLTYYFRTTVTLPALGVGDALSVDVNYDDSFIMYLNGVEVARASITATGTNLTHETAGASHEADGYETFELDLSGVTLVEGDNTLAVEVHQTNRGSSDAVLDVRFNALVKEQAEPTGPPNNVVASVVPVSGNIDEGGTATFSVSSGGAQPQTYEWFRGLTSVGTGPTLVIANATPADNGDYSVTASNGEGSASSAGVTLTVNAETNRPTVVTCVSRADLTTIVITFDEVMDATTAQNTANYSVVGATTGARAVSAAVLSLDGTSVTLTTAARTLAENYSVTITGLEDASFNGNLIDPNPTVCQVALELLPVDAVWSYREDDVVLSNDWFTAAYDVSSWSTGPGIFGFEPNLEDEINTPFDRIYTNTVTMVTNTTQTLTFYFRTTFSGAGHAAGNDLVVVGRYDDAVIVYLNGVEVGRDGVDEAISRTTNTPEEVHAEPGASHESDQIESIVLDSAGLVVGSNLIAVELHQQNATSSDAIMGLGVYSILPPPPSCTPEDPTIVDNGDGTVTVTWAGLGELHSSVTVDGTYSVVATTSPAVITKTTATAFFQVVCP